MGLRKYSGLDLIRFRKFANELPEMGNLELIKRYKEKYPELTAKEQLVNLAVGLGMNDLHRSLTGTDLPPDSGWDKPETSDEALPIANVVKPKGTLPCIQRCSVCHTIIVNHVGSTPCCAGMAEYLYEDEVEELGFVVNLTRNKGIVRSVEG